MSDLSEEIKMTLESIELAVKSEDKVAALHHISVAFEEIQALQTKVKELEALREDNETLIAMRNRQGIDIHKLGAEVQSLKQSSEWVSVEERLPEEEGDYLVYYREPWGWCMKGVYFSDGDFHTVFKVTHWQPITPPKEQELSDER